MKTVACKRCGKGFDVPDSNMSQVCPACHNDRKRSYMREYMRAKKLDSRTPFNRSCHDCGKPTNDYRCETCLGKWRARNDVPICGGDEVEWVEVPC